jgi:hypothetical protein
VETDKYIAIVDLNFVRQRRFGGRHRQGGARFDVEFGPMPRTGQRASRRVERTIGE